MTNRERLSKEIQAKYLEIGRFVANFNAPDARLEVSMADSLDIGGLPIGLAHGVRPKTPIAAGRSSPAEERPGQEGRDGGGALLRMGLVLLADGDTGPPSRPQRPDRRVALAPSDTPVPLLQFRATPDSAAFLAPLCCSALPDPGHARHSFLEDKGLQIKPGVGCAPEASLPV